MYALISKLVVTLLLIAVLLWLPLVPAFAIDGVCYKSGHCLTVRDRCEDFVEWYADHVLKPVFDPLLKM